jgi:hypothetical protein
MNLIHTDMLISLRCFLLFKAMCKGKKGKTIPVTGRGDQLICVTSRLQHFLDNRLTDGGEVVSLTRWLADLYSQEYSWYSFKLEAESTPEL